MSHVASRLGHLHLRMLRESDVDLLAIQSDATQVGYRCIERGDLNAHIVACAVPEAHNEKESRTVQHPRT